MDGPLTIRCIGAGPAGLYFAVLMKTANPAHRIEVYERNRPDDTFGFGVVFSDSTMGFLTEQDRRSYPEIMAASRHWDPLTVIHGATEVKCHGVGFSAIERVRLLQILQDQAANLGVELHFQCDIPNLADLGDADLIVGADGVNSMVRAAIAEHVRPSIALGATRFAWLGTTRAFDSLTFLFGRNEDGVFGVHIYPYADDRSTFIIETDEATWQRAGMEDFSEADTIAYGEKLFAPYLDGHRLLSNRSLWQQFRTVHNARWHHENIVLVGDAAHTAHFSVGSGTKMAMEDALALSQAITRASSVSEALIEFEGERRPRVEHIQRMARASAEWFANVRSYVDFPPLPFAFHSLTRSLFRYDTLKQRDPTFLQAVECAQPEIDLAARTCAAIGPVRANACGLPGTAHREALLNAAGEGTRLLLAGHAAISAEGRITPFDAGLWSDEQMRAWTALVADVQAAAPVRIGIQLLHAGPRGACRFPDEALDEPLPDGAWPLISASARRYSPRSTMPRAMDEEDMTRVERDFAAAAERARDAGFDWLELQFGHGYLLGAFISPLTNRRTDTCGGDLAGRLRFPLRVLDAIRAAWPDDRLLSVAISASDDAPGGTTIEETMQIAQLLGAHACDLVTVQSGQTISRSVAPFGRCFTMLAAGRIRNEAGVPTMAAGGITDLDDVKTVLLSRRADYVRLDHARLRPA